MPEYKSDSSVYDGRGRRTSFTSRLATDIATFNFDANSNLLTLTDSQTGVTSYSPTTPSHPHMGINDHVAYTFDAAHRMASRVDQILGTSISSLADGGLATRHIWGD